MTLIDELLYCMTVYNCLIAQNLVDHVTIVTSSAEDYLPTVKEPTFDKVRMQYMHAKESRH